MRRRPYVLPLRRCPRCGTRGWFTRLRLFGRAGCPHGLVGAARGAA